MNLSYFSITHARSGQPKHERHNKNNKINDIFTKKHIGTAKNLRLVTKRYQER
jgi:hypothetical protein